MITTPVSHLNSRNALAIDLIRVLALLQVLLLHATEVYLKFAHLRPGRDLAALVVMTTITRPAVPLFVILSGFLHLVPEKADEPLGQFFRKKANRLKPALTWLVIYWVWKNNGALTPGSFFEAMIGGGTYLHLWYIYLIVGLYLITPVLRKFTKDASDALLIYALAVWFVFTSANYLGLIFPYTLAVARFFSAEYVGYYLFGHWLDRFQQRLGEIPQQIKDRWLIGLTGALTALMAILCVLAYHRIVELSKFNVLYLVASSPLVIGVAISIAIGLVLLNDRLVLEGLISPTVVRWIKTLSQMSFSIYLAHMLVLKTLASFEWIPQYPMSVGAVVLFAFTLLITTVLIGVVHRIPLLRDWL